MSLLKRLFSSGTTETAEVKNKPPSAVIHESGEVREFKSTLIDNGVDSSLEGKEKVEPPPSVGTDESFEVGELKNTLGNGVDSSLEGKDRSPHSERKHPSSERNSHSETYQKEDLSSRMKQMKVDKKDILFMLNMEERKEKKKTFLSYYERREQEDLYRHQDMGRRKSFEDLFNEMKKDFGGMDFRREGRFRGMDPRDHFRRHMHHEFERRRHRDFHDMMDFDMMDYDDDYRRHRRRHRSDSDDEGDYMNPGGNGVFLVPDKFVNQVLNHAGGFSFETCDMTRLQRFLVLGREVSNYYAEADPDKLMSENVECVQKLLENGYYKEVLDVIEQYSIQGRVPKEDPILLVLSICATHQKVEVRQAAYEKVNKICNIPTKLFRFIDLTQHKIELQRKENPPQAELRKKRKEELKRKPKEPVENDEEPNPKKVKKTVSEYKTVNIEARRSLGWGRMRRNAISKFYTDEKKEATRLLYLLTKYKKRHNWSHNQVLTYTHPKITGDQSEAKNLVLRYCARGYKKVEQEMLKIAMKPGLSQTMSEVIDYIKIIHEVSGLKVERPEDEERLLKILSTYGIRQRDDAIELAIPGVQADENDNKGKLSAIHIVREHLPTPFLNNVKVWEALLQDMPMTAMIRNLGKMSSMGMFNEDSKNTQIVVEALNSERRLKGARIHPMKILIAYLVYKEGKGVEGDLTWKVNFEIKNALNAAFYKCFRTPTIAKNYEIGKRFMVCLDISPSMQDRSCVGCPLISPAQASIAMALVTLNVEKDVKIMGFGDKFVDLTRHLHRDMTIEQALKATKDFGMCGTDCALPMRYAFIHKIEADCFVVYTDNETNGSKIPPVNALRIYNSFMNLEAKLIVCAMKSNGFTIADPNDPNCLDLVGFDSHAPDIMSSFARGDASSRCNVCCKN